MPTTKHSIVGSVSYTVLSGGAIRLEPGWESANIGTAFIPQLKGVPTYGGNKFSGNVRFYKPAIPQLKAAFSEVERAGLKDKILFWDGSFVPRLVRGGTSPSNHSFGTAFDINAQWNPFKRPPAARGAKGDLHDVAQVFKRHGFTWGGDWKNTPDGMHFEVNRIMKPEELQAERPKPALILVTKDSEGDLVYTRLNSATLSDGRFYADKLELLKLIFGDGRVPVVEYLSGLGMREFSGRGDYLSDDEDPRMYLSMD